MWVVDKVEIIFSKIGFVDTITACAHIADGGFRVHDTGGIATQNSRCATCNIWGLDTFLGIVLVSTYFISGYTQTPYKVVVAADKLSTLWEHLHPLISHSDWRLSVQDNPIKHF